MNDAGINGCHGIQVKNLRFARNAKGSVSF